MKSMKEIMETIPESNIRLSEIEGQKWIEIRKDYEESWEKSFVYEIDMSTIRDARSIVAWVYHLTRKNWVTGKIINEFVSCCALQLEISMHI